jgi:hypothetical protein
MLELKQLLTALAGKITGAQPNNRTRTQNTHKTQNQTITTRNLRESYKGKNGITSFLS